MQLKVKLAVHYSTCAIKFCLVPEFSQKFRILPKYFFFNLNEIKIEINFIL